MVDIQFVLVMRKYLKGTFNSQHFFHINNRTHIEQVFFLICIAKKILLVDENILRCNINSAWKIYISILYVVGDNNNTCT